MHGLTQQKDMPTLDEYMDQLESQWLRFVACQNQCHPTEECKCVRYIIHIDAVKAWWRRTISASTGHTKLKRLLDEMPTAAHHVFPLEETLFTGEYSCLGVFSLLLRQGRGHLVDRFYSSDMNDRYLAIVRNDSDQNLRNSLAQVVPRSQVGTIVDEFEQERWSYCPLELTLLMDRNLQGTRVIPPFCHKVKLGDKGGTASIYWVAVQEDLISDEGLKAALHESLYQDNEYGKCYQMVLKSYCGKQKDAFDLERTAFLGLKSTQEMPIVRYLGCYTHEYGEGKLMGKTYNLLLEYGEGDLYESWADETNVPPVRAKEILRYWKSLFTIADAIRLVHNPHVLRGRSAPLMYNGWHADIKPDNILIVRGRMKLADFGFSRFAPVVQVQDGAVPTELIEGFTDTYGAPEVSSKRPDGTLSGVSQSIDTWSFGCVLSVAATWVVLGFQGVRQYEQLRQLAPSNIRDNKTYDRFHNGADVLPEIRKWHNYLRGHLRPSDTTTPLVLELIENNMLQADIRNRFDLGKLCKQLKWILSTATGDLKNLDANSKDTDELVLMALLKIEKYAQDQKSSKPKTTPLQQQSMVVEPPSAPNPRRKASLQIRKANMIKSKQLGRTAHRIEILEGELMHKTPASEVVNHIVKSVYDGAMTESPTQVSFSSPFQFVKRDKPANPELGSNSDSKNTFTVQPSPDNSSYPERRLYDPSHPPPSMSSDYTHDLARYSQNSEVQHAEPRRTPKNTTGTIPHIAQLYGKDQHSALAHYPTYPTHETDKNERLHDYSPPPASAPAIAPPFDNTDSGSVHSNTSPYYTPAKTTMIGNGQTPTPLPTVYAHFVPPLAPSVPQIRAPTPRNTYPNLISNTSPWTQPSPLTPTDPAAPAPSIRLMEAAEFDTSRGSPKTIHNDQHVAEEKITTQNDPHRPPGFVQHAPLPNHVYQLPFDVCRARENFEQPEQPISRGFLSKVKDKLGKETQKPDANFVDTFNDRRELIFVVDNGATMFRHWPILVFVAETLVKKAAGLDKSGVDLRFTVGGQVHNQKELKGNAGRKLFRQTLEKAWPAHNPNNHNSTHMDDTLGEVLRDWRTNHRPRTTLLVLTDAAWPDDMDDTIRKTIVQFASESAEQHVGRRHFSIQFIRFDDHGIERLQWLDDELCKKYDLRDIIDHCSWRATIGKMLTGSIEAYEDQRDAPEPPIPYDYQELVDFFATYNKESSNLLSPSSPPPTLSRSSSRGSNAGRDNKHHSTPPVRAESWNTQHHRKTFSG